MGTFKNLPLEVVAAILGELDDIESLAPCLLSCRHVYSAFGEDRRVLPAILQRQVGPALLPIATAAMEAAKLPGPKPGNASSDRKILAILSEDHAQLARRLQNLPQSDIRAMFRMHHIVRHFVNDFATDAWTLLSRQDPASVSGSLSLSRAEEFRLFRAFYRVELFLQLSRDNEEGPVDLGDFPYRQFFAALPPEATEQAACIHDFLEKRFAQSTYDVTAHDVEFGINNEPVDYLRMGADNTSRQKWLSQGLELIYDIVREESYDKQKTLLIDTRSKGHENFALTISGRVRLDPDAVEDRVKYSPLTMLLPDDQDVDKGPQTVVRFVDWAPNYGGSSRFLQPEAAGLREQAYVLWDLERLEKYNLKQVFAKTPEVSTHDRYTLEDGNCISDMLDSWFERT